VSAGPVPPEPAPTEPAWLAPKPAPPGIDVEALAAYLAGGPVLAQGPLTASLVTGGRSNLTYLVTDGVDTVVLRRPPLGHVLATAHDMAREYRVMTALSPTPVPVPRTLHLCQDPGVIGAPFYLMERVDGPVYRRRGDSAHLTQAQRHDLSAALVDVLADLHSVDAGTVGLDDFGRPDGYLARQVRRWSTQLEHSRSRELPGMAALRDALAASVPTTRRTAVLHGDYRLDNVIVDPADPGRVAALLDWEMATLGDPLADLGLMLVYAAGPGGPGNPVSDPMTGDGFAGRDEIVGRYAARTGADVGNLAWYEALGYFKLAVILEGIHYRFVHGQTVGEGFEHIGELVPPLVAAGRARLEDR
jgi:aminoglycoside phosphotransferase (APT) family kinase protein